MEKELTIIINLVDEDDDGKVTTLKENVKYKQYINVRDILNPCQVLKENGKPHPHRCKAMLREYGIVIFAHSYEYIKSLKKQLMLKTNPEQSVRPIGFKMSVKDDRRKKRRKS